jgi:hypothetical protein
MTVEPAYTLTTKGRSTLFHIGHQNRRLSLYLPLLVWYHLADQ